MGSTAKNEKKCYFCENNINDIDYKDTDLLRKFLNFHMKIISAKRTGNCAWHQRKLATAIKRARIMALISFTRK
jgi:small subunit ribosomal protein S18